MTLVFSVFLFSFLFINNAIGEELDENDFRLCYDNFFSKVMFKVFSQQLHSTLTMTFERHLTIENFTEMD